MGGRTGKGREEGRITMLDFIIKHPLRTDMILISICLIFLLWCVLDLYKLKREGTPYEQALKQIERERKENIKRQIERNLQAKNRKQAIFELLDNFGYRNITVDYTSDRFYVIIKINKDVLIEREVK